MPRTARVIAVVLLIAACAGRAPAGPLPDAAERSRAAAKQAAALLAGGKFADAEAALVEAAELDPRNPAHRYNLACARARLGRHDEAIDDLERAARLGFSDFAQVARDADLANLRPLPQFKRFLARRDLYLRRTAEGTLTALRNRFGEDGYQYAIDDEARLVFAVAMDEAGFAQLRADMAEQAKALRAALFEQGPEAYVAVLMPTVKDYGKLVRFRNVPGLYVETTRTLVARERGYVLTHEFTHALHAADRAASGQAHAPWVAEGLGAMCEAATFTEGRFEPRDNQRFAALTFAASRKAMVPLERLVAMDQQEFVRRPNLTYGQSAYLMLYLWEQGLLRKFYDTYKATHAADPSGRAALERVTGEALPAFQETWRRWLAERGAKPGSR